MQKIFQLESVNKSEFDENDISVLKAYNLEITQFPDPNWVDRWFDNIQDDETNLESLFRQLPNGAFEMDKETMCITLVDKKPLIDYADNYINKIKEEASLLNLKDYLSHKHGTWNIECLLRNNNNKVMVFESEYNFPVYLSEWLIRLASNDDEINTKYYLGGVLDYC